MATPMRSARRDLLMAMAVFWAIASLTFTVGRWFVPGFAVGEVADRLGPDAIDSPEARQARLFDLQTATGGLDHAAAAMDASGALEGRVTFEHLDGFELTQTDADGNPWQCETDPDHPGADCRYDIKIRVRDDEGTVLLVSGRGLLPDADASTGFSVTVSSPGLTFNSKPGQCTMGLTAVDIFVPRVAGWASCTGLIELRSGATLDLLAYFDAAVQSRF